MKKKRKRYTQEFKEESIKLIKEQGYGIEEASNEFEKVWGQNEAA